MKLGLTLERLLKERRLTVADLSHSIGVPRKTLDEWHGAGARTPRDLDAVRKAAQFLGVSFHYLLFGEEEKTLNKEVKNN